MMRFMKSLTICSAVLAIFMPVTARAITTVTVGGTGTGHYATVQLAENALPSTGGQINVTPGTYSGQVTISKPNVRLIGMGAHASSTILTFDSFAQKSNGAGGTVGDIGSATVYATSAATNFFFENIQIQNTYTQEGHTETQALALALYADRTVGYDAILIGRQDTFFAGANGCTTTNCTKPTRVYLHDMTIEGNVDFIFGDAAVVLDTCTIQIDEHTSLSGETTVTAQNKRSASGYLSGFVMYNSKVITNPSTGFTNDYLGRPWGTYATNIYINTNMQAAISTPGWIEFTPGTTNNLPTSYYAEYGSTGAGAAGYTAHTRESHVIYLTAAQIVQYEPNNYLKGSDNWVPTSVS
jgi:pectin methylesterase-like acyl-CoA thioesterase